jgi:hypothetical protein
MNFSSRNINTIAPLYKRLLEIVFESLRERIDAHPFFRTLLQMPKAISRIIVNMAKSTIGLTGANTVIIETRKRDLVFIRVNDMPSKVECHTGCE